MKKYNIILIAIMAFALGSCLEDTLHLANNNTQSAATIDVPPNEPYILGVTTTIDLVIDATKFSDVSNIQSVKVVKSFQGSNGSEVDIDAGNVTSFPSTLSFAIDDLLSGVGIGSGDLGPGDVWTFAYVVTLNDGRVLKPAGTTSVPFSCASDLAGMYSVTTTYGYHDFLPAESTNTIDVEVTDEGNGSYSVLDFSGGLYSIGSYSVNYGTSSFNVTFSDVCGNIGWTDQSDTWGPVEATAAGVNSIDANGVITISWSCLAYGENGVSVYTPK